MDARAVKRYLTALDMGCVTAEQKAAAVEHTAEITAWMQSPEGRDYLLGRDAADSLRKFMREEEVSSEAEAAWFCQMHGVVSKKAESVLRRLLLDAFYRGFAVLAADVAAGKREAGVTFAEEGRERLAAAIEPEIAERQRWLRDSYDRIRDGFPAGSRGDKQARADVIAKYRKAFGPTLGDRMVRRDLNATSK